MGCGLFWLDMIESDTLIIDTTTRIFQELADPQAVLAASDDSWKVALWNALEEAGLTLAWVNEDYGGAGVAISDGFDILKVAGRSAVAVPLAETLLAGWLLAEAGLHVPQGPMTVAMGSRANPLRIKDGNLHGSTRGVSFPGSADHVACVADGESGPQVVLVKSESADIEVNFGMAGDEIGQMVFNCAPAVAAAPLPNTSGPEDIMLMGAAMRAQQIAGALQAVLDLSVSYVQERYAFGRPIAKFQAVQQNLARLAGETAAATAIAASAGNTINHAETFDAAVLLEVAAAKIRCGEAATEGAAIAHQAHGAMGFTDDYSLHRFTLRMFQWRDDFGSEAEWAADLGAMVAANGADQLWPMLASR